MITQGYGDLMSDVTVRSMITASVIPPIAPQIAKNFYRQKICFANGSGVYRFYLAYGSTVGSTTDYTIILNPGDYFEDTTSIDSISVVANGTSLTDYLYVTEMS